jgi:hypothetical protein
MSKNKYGTIKEIEKQYLDKQNTVLTYATGKV